MTSLVNQVEVCCHCGRTADEATFRTAIEIDDSGDLDITYECPCGFRWYLHHQEEVWSGVYDPDADAGEEEDEGDCDDEGC